MSGTETRDRIIAAAIETLQKHGYLGATARAIAAAGGFNQALIYYYFNDLDELFLAALDQTSAARMSAYLEHLDQVSSLSELVHIARELFEEDARAGHITVLTEVMGAALGNPALGKQITQRMEPWVRFAQATIDRFIKGTPFDAMVQTRPLAESIVAFYLGMETMVHLDGNRDRAKALFEMATNAVPFLNAIMGSA